MPDIINARLNSNNGLYSVIKWRANWGLLDFAALCKSLLRFAKVCYVLQMFALFCKTLLRFAKLCTNP